MFIVTENAALRKLKNINSSITQAILTKLHVHYHSMAIYIQHKIHEIRSIPN